MNTSTAIAVALAVAIALGFVFYGPSFFGAHNNNSTTTQKEQVTKSAPVSTAQAADKLSIKDDVVGTGAVAKKGDTISVAYIGTLTNGTVFDSTSKHNGEPFTFTLGAGHVIAGWDQGVAGMKVGGERTLVIPPSLGYGSQASDKIPANSTLIFKIKLLKVVPPAK
ncbi:MAG TPA: FKBP-type peptidyl-prolyl cis-trans isomerase [Candidatus Kaiserbacteria bacterium]|nr:FKBP-type peptidyl-prolyl cis-trans isomerase [Candidatus Kaiserbacteria bacterium]